MFPRFCKLCYQTADESIINVRWASRYKYDKESAARYNYDEYYEPKDDNEQSYQNQEPEKQKKEKEKNKFCIIKCKNPKFNFYKDQTFPNFEAIPLASRGWHHRKSKGDFFTIYPFENINEKETVDESISFYDYNLDNRLLKSIEENGLIHPTPIQTMSIPKILSGQNVALTAETGCGKTYGFLIPLMQQILQWKKLTPERGVNKPLGLILTPSKELTLQIAKVAKKLAQNLDISIIKFIGGRTQKIKRNPPILDTDIIIGTIGIINKLISANCYSTDYVRHVILDEADTLLDESFMPIAHHILRKIPIGAFREQSPNGYPDTAALTLNSATIPQNLSTALEDIIDPNSVETVTTGYEHQIKVPQKFLRLGGSEKPMMLLKLIKPKAKSKIPVVIFCNSTETCNFTSIFLQQYGIKCTRLHKKLSLNDRKKKLREFELGQTTVLTTTDAGSRGLDTTMARDVINFDFPLLTAEYIHRCGRVGRIGSPINCLIYNFISKPLEIVITSKIEFATRKMKPIPMLDFITKKYDEEGQFLHSQEMERNMNRQDDDEEDDNSDSEDNKMFDKY